MCQAGSSRNAESEFCWMSALTLFDERAVHLLQLHQVLLSTIYRQNSSCMTAHCDDIIVHLPLHLLREIDEIFMIQFLFAERLQGLNAKNQ